MESPTDTSCTIHKNSNEFYDSYQLYLKDYREKIARSEDLKKKNNPILNMLKSKHPNKDEIM